MLDIGELRASVVVDNSKVPAGLAKVRQQWQQSNTQIAGESKRAGSDAGKQLGDGMASQVQPGLANAGKKLDGFLKQTGAASQRSGETAGKAFGGGFRDRLRSVKGDSQQAGDDAGRGFLRGATSKLQQGGKDLRSGFGRGLAALRDDAGKEGKHAGERFGGGFSTGVKSLAAGAAGYLALDSLTTFLSGAREQATNLGETLNKSSAIFGENEADIEKWAEGSARSMGLSKSATLEQTAAFGDMFQQIGFTGGEAAKQSKTIVQFAADLGSFSNLETGDVLDRISAALRGEYDSLQAVIPNINAARVEQEAMAKTGVKNASALTAQQKAQAVLTIVQEDGKRAAGDFAKTSGSLANQQKILGAQFEDIQAKVGQKLIPMFVDGAQAVSGFLGEMADGKGVGGDVAEVLGGLADTGMELGKTLTHDVLPPVAGVAKLLGGTLLGSSESAKTALGGVLTILAARKAQGFADSLDLAGQKLQKAEGRVGAFGGKVSTMSRGLSGVASFLGGPWGIAIGLGVTALVGLATKHSDAEKAAKDFTDTLHFEAGALDQVSKASYAKRLADEGVLASVREAGVGEKEYLDALTAGGEARQKMIDQLRETQREHTTMNSINGIVSSSTDSVGEAARRAADSLAAEGVGLDKSAAGARAASDALKTNKTVSDELKEAQDALKTGQENLTAAQKAANDEFQKAINKFTILRDGYLSGEQATAQYEAALDQLEGSVKSNGRSLSVHTEKGRANRAMIVDSVQALNDKIKADYESTLKTKGSKKATEEASEALKKGKADILKSAEAAGLNTTKVGGMIKEMVKTPKELKTTVSAPGVDSTKNKVRDLKNNIVDLKGRLVEINFKSDADKLIKKYKLEGVGSVPFMHTATGGFAGLLPGKTPLWKGDDMALPLVGGGRQALRGGEGVYVTEAMSDPYERSRMLAVNKAALRGEKLSRFQNEGLDTGGLVGRRIQVGASQLGGLPTAVAKGAADITSRMAGAQTDELGDALTTRLQQAMKRRRAKLDAEAGGEGGPIGKGGYAKALAWLRRNAGHPYVYATIWDCSGIVGAAHSIIKGESPHRRYATPTFVGPKAGGFTRGKKSPLMIAVNPSPGKLGHMVGQLNGVPFEEAGGVGLRVGASARRLSNPMFSWRGGLARGGQVQGDLPFDTLDPEGQRFNPWLAEMAKRAGLVRGYAVGTPSAAPGFGWTAEKQAELVVNPQLRRYSGGERVYNGDETKRLLSGRGGRQYGDINLTTSDRARDAVGELVYALRSAESGGVYGGVL